MNDTDTISISGDFKLTIKKNGEIIEEYEEKNMIMDVAKIAMSYLIGGDGGGKVITRIGFGSDGNGPTPLDTDISNMYIKNLTSHTYPFTGHVQFNWTLSTSEANNLAIREFGLICSDDTLFARKTRQIIQKEDDISLEGSWTIIF